MSAFDPVMFDMNRHLASEAAREDAWDAVEDLRSQLDAAEDRMKALFAMDDALWGDAQDAELGALYDCRDALRREIEAGVGYSIEWHRDF